jgi:hypothetical protein
MPVITPRGGQQQRINRASASENQILQSALATFLLEQFAWGHFSGQLVQQIAELAIKDAQAMQENPNGKLLELESLARVGSNGKHSQHVHRDIMALTNNKTQLPVPCKVVLPFGRQLGDQTQTILLPHEVFSSIYHKYKDTWQKSILPSQDVLTSFWDANQGHPNMANHPIQLLENYRTKCIPLGMHGDEVPVTGKGKCWSKSMLTFQWISLIGLGGTRDRVMWIWSVFDQCLQSGPEGTLQCFWKVLSWSLEWLMKGLWPSHDWNGVRFNFFHIFC